MFAIICRRIGVWSRHFISFTLRVLETSLVNPKTIECFEMQHIEYSILWRFNRSPSISSQHIFVSDLPSPLMGYIYISNRRTHRNVQISDGSMLRRFPGKKEHRIQNVSDPDMIILPLSGLTQKLMRLEKWNVVCGTETTNTQIPVIYHNAGTKSVPEILHCTNRLGVVWSRLFAPEPVFRGRHPHSALLYFFSSRMAETEVRPPFLEKNCIWVFNGPCEGIVLMYVATQSSLPRGPRVVRRYY